MNSGFVKNASFFAITTINFIIIVNYLSISTNYLIYVLEIPVTIVFDTYKMILASDVLPAVTSESRYLLLVFSVAGIGGLLFFCRRSIAFVFLLFNTTALLICIILDFIAYKDVDAWGQVASGAFNFFLIVIYISVCFFSLFLKLSLRNIVNLCICGAFSLFCLFFAVIVLSVFSMGFSGATLIFLFYAVLAYGVFGLHIWSLSWLLQSAGERDETGLR